MWLVLGTGQGRAGAGSVCARGHARDGRELWWIWRYGGAGRVARIVRHARRREVFRGLHRGRGRVQGGAVWAWRGQRQRRGIALAMAWPQIGEHVRRRHEGVLREGSLSPRAVCCSWVPPSLSSPSARSERGQSAARRGGIHASRRGHRLTATITGSREDSRIGVMAVVGQWQWQRQRQLVSWGRTVRKACGKGGSGNVGGHDEMDDD